MQESNSQLIFEKDFDNGSIDFLIQQQKRQFYRDTASLSSEASGVRWSAAVQALPIYSTAQGNEGLPLGYSNKKLHLNVPLKNSRPVFSVQMEKV